jgi:serine/threonine protein kinase
MDKTDRDNRGGPLPPPRSTPTGDITEVLDAEARATGIHVVGPSEEVPRGQGGLIARTEQRYKIGRMVARGGMGGILEATDLNVQRSVAMKIMLHDGKDNPRQLSRFVVEAQITGQLEHPNIVPVYELGVDEVDNVYYTMKFIKGVDLQQVLDKIEKGDEATIEAYPLHRLLTIIQRACDAIAYAHSKGIMHRDLKPENIMIGDFGEVLVLDWGLAMVYRGHSANDADVPHIHVNLVDEEGNEVVVDDFGDVNHTLSGQVMGTPQNMSPEQAQNRREELNHLTDIYALGGILYTVLTLKAPVDGETIREVINNAASGRIVNPLKHSAAAAAADDYSLPHLPAGRVPESLAAVTMKALSFVPQHRYQSVTELQAEIDNYLRGFATIAEQASAIKQIGLLINRHKRVAAAAAVTAVVIVLLTVNFILRLDSERNEAVLARAEAEDLLNELVQKDASLAKVRQRAAPEFVTKAAKSIEMKHWDEALKASGIAVNLDPELGMAWMQKGRVHLARQELKDAAVAFSKANHYSTDDNEAHLAGVLAPICERYAAIAQANGGILPSSDRLQLAEAVEFKDVLIAAELTGMADKGQARRLRLMLAAAARGLERANPGLSLAERQYTVDPSGVTFDLSRESKVTTISPLAKLPINHLNLRDTSVSSIDVVADMPLQSLNLIGTRVLDLAPLTETQIHELRLDRLTSESAAVLRELPLISLVLTGPNITRVDTIAGARITALTLDATAVTDLSPLEGMKLVKLDVSRTAVNSLEPLVGMPLVELNLYGTRLTDIGSLQGLPLRSLNLGFSKVTRLDHLEGLPLTHLDLRRTDVADIRPLAGMRLQSLNLSVTRVESIEPIAALPLTELSLYNCSRLTSLAPLANHPTLESLTIPDHLDNIDVLKTLPKLKYLDTRSGSERRPAAQFWRDRGK